jgi:hypothetical protein
MGYAGAQHQKGEKVMASIDHHGYVLSPLPVAPVHETDMLLLREGLKALKKVAKQVGLDLQGAYLCISTRVVLPPLLASVCSTPA